METSTNKGLKTISILGCMFKSTQLNKHIKTIVIYTETKRINPSIRASQVNRKRSFLYTKCQRPEHETFFGDGLSLFPNWNSFTPVGLLSWYSLIMTMGWLQKMQIIIPAKIARKTVRNILSQCLNLTRHCTQSWKFTAQDAHYFCFFRQLTVLHWVISSDVMKTDITAD